MAQHSEHTEVSPATRQAEREEAAVAHVPDRPPTAEEDAAVNDEPVDQSTCQHYQEMAERGANLEGEGRIP